MYYCINQLDHPPKTLPYSKFYQTPYFLLNATKLLAGQPGFVAILIFESSLNTLHFIQTVF